MWLWDISEQQAQNVLNQVIFISSCIVILQMLVELIDTDGVIGLLTIFSAEEH